MRRKAREAVLRCLYRWEFLKLPPEELLAEVDLPQEVQDFERSLHRNILPHRLYELLFTETPPEVVIDEAVELAKAYGTERAPAVINAILDRVWKEGRRGTLG